MRLGLGSAIPWQQGWANPHLLEPRFPRLGNVSEDTACQAGVGTKEKRHSGGLLLCEAQRERSVRAAESLWPPLRTGLGAQCDSELAFPSRSAGAGSHFTATRFPTLIVVQEGV